MSPANLRRRNRALERRADSAGTLYVISIMWLTAGAAFFGVSVLGWIAILGVRSFL